MKTKKILLLSFIVFSLNLKTVQAQIPNAGFEMGYNIDSSIKHWWNNQVYSIGLTDSIITDGPWVSLSTNSYSGLYALELRSSFNVTQNVGHTLHVSCYSDSSLFGFGTTENFPIVSAPSSLSFYYKFAQNPFNDTAKVKIRILNSDFFEIGVGTAKLWDVAGSYQSKTIPIQYVTTVPSGNGDSIPAFAAISFTTIITDAVPHVGLRFLVDDLSLISQPNAVINKARNNELTIFPNPVLNSFTIKSSLKIKSISILTMLGEEVYKQNYNVDKIDISHLPNGVYFLQVNSDKGVQTYRVLKTL